MLLTSFATNWRFAIAGLRDGGPVCALCADSAEALVVDWGELVVPEDVRSVLSYFSPSLLDDLRRLRVRRFSARRRSGPETMSM